MLGGNEVIVEDVVERQDAASVECPNGTVAFFDARTDPITYCIPEPQERRRRADPTTAAPTTAAPTTAAPTTAAPTTAAPTTAATTTTTTTTTKQSYSPQCVGANTILDGFH